MVLAQIYFYAHPAGVLKSQHYCAIYCVRLPLPLGDEPPLITLRVVPPAAGCAVVRGVLPGVLTPPLTPPARGAAAPPSGPPSSAASSSSRPSWPSCEGVRRRVSAWLTLD